jgi:chromate reductase
MRKPYEVAVLVGSIRTESITRGIARALIAAAPPQLVPAFVEFETMPIYNEDLESQNPPEWVVFRSKILSVDAVLFVTPEYNRSIPGGLKNALDVGSRPLGKNVWDGKPGAVVSVTPGAMGGFGANHHLRQSLVFLNVLAMAQPEAYIGHAEQIADESGNIAAPDTAVFFKKIMDSFAAWIDRLQEPDSSVMPVSTTLADSGREQHLNGALGRATGPDIVSTL